MCALVKLRIFVAILFLVILLFSIITFNTFLASNLKTVEYANTSRWRVYYEKRDESAYRFNLGEETSGLEISLYINTLPEDSLGYSNDWIRITLVGKPIEITASGATSIAEPIAGLTRIGYSGDNEKSVGGLHVSYYILPKKSYINYINITLHSPLGRPQLDLIRSRIRIWNPDTHMEKLITWGLGWHKYNITENGKASTALVSFGAPVNDQPMESGIAFSFGKAFTPPNILWRPNIYVEIGYAGGINIAPESFVGIGNYSCKIDVGIGGGKSLDEAMSSGHSYTVYRVVKGTALPPPAEEGASGSIDVLLEIGQEILKSPAAKTILEGLSYALFVYDLASTVASLGFDETVAKSEIVVFKNVDIGNEQFFAWLSFYAWIKSAGLSGGIVNFWGKFPFGSSIFDRYGLGSVVDLPNGGMQIGGILIDYYDPHLPSPADYITIRSDGYVEPITQLVTSSDMVTYHIVSNIDNKIDVRKSNVLIDGGGYVVKGVLIKAANVTIENFRIEGADYGVYVWRPFNVSIRHNTIAGNDIGIGIFTQEFHWEGPGFSVAVSDNNITHNRIGIEVSEPQGVWDAQSCVNGKYSFFRNNISFNSLGMFIRTGACYIFENFFKGNNKAMDVVGGFVEVSKNKVVDCAVGMYIASDVTICQGNYIENAGTGIYVDAYHNTSVLRNTIVKCENSITVHGGLGFSNISNNNILDCAHGILANGFGLNISSNNVNAHIFGIYFYPGAYVYTNNISNAEYCIYVALEHYEGGRSKIFMCNIMNCGKGIYVNGTTELEIRRNNILNNTYGVFAPATQNYNVHILENNFLYNNISIFLEDSSSFKSWECYHNNFVGGGVKCSRYEPGYHGFWDNGYPSGGNYWSGYSGVDEKSGDAQTAPGGDGIGDSPHHINYAFDDRYPLMEPCGNLIPLTIKYIVQEGKVVEIKSNSLITNFKYSSETHTISFYTQWRKGTTGFIDIKIPKTLEKGKAEVLFDKKPIQFNITESTNFTNIIFTYENSRHEITISFGQGESHEQWGLVYTVLGMATALLLAIAAIMKKHLVKKLSY